jgi:putative transcriptional regulator
MKRSAFEKVMQGLQEARDYLDGKPVPGLVVHKVKVNRSEVAAIRIKAGLTQGEFAGLLGASVGTVRKWESGERSPSGAAASLLRVIDYSPGTVSKALGVKPREPKRAPRSRLVAAE